MYEIAEQVRSWLAEGCDAQVATVVATRGFSSREPVATAAWHGGHVAGGLGLGVPVSALTGSGLIDITVGEQEAAAAGLACPGTARVLVLPAAAYPDALWDRLAAREPLCLVTTLIDGLGVTEMYSPATIGTAYEFGSDIGRLFGRGRSGALVQESDPTTVAVALWPVPTLVVVGDGLIAEALRHVAALLGWRTSVTGDVDTAVALAGQLHRSDAVVVLSHDREVDGPALAAALAGTAGYVGALGSRATQEARREWLTGHGVLGKDQARIHGPAGLDIDAHTPAEIAISIVAEILASRGASTGGALKDRPGPVHASGVQAPPPRHD